MSELLRGEALEEMQLVASSVQGKPRRKTNVGREEG